METKMVANEQFQVAEIELVYRRKVKASERPKVTCSGDAYKVLMDTWDQDKIDFLEQFKILLLDRGQSVLAIYELSTGGITGTVADPRIIFAAALKCNAVSMMLAHNHPSSNLRPSKADDQLTSKIRQAGLFLDIKVLDHLIVCNEGYYSYADEGAL